MNRKPVLATPLIIAIAITLLVTPAIAEPKPPNGNGHLKFCFSQGIGFGRSGILNYDFGQCFRAYFGYCFRWGHAVLDLGELGKDDCEGVWKICEASIYECGWFHTFTAKWVESTEQQDMGLKELYFDNELEGSGDIRVITFLKNGERVLTIVFGPGIFYIGSGSVCIEIDTRPE